MVSAQIRKIFAPLAAAGALAVLVAAAVSCTRDELGFDPSDEGQLTEVTLRWSTPEMDERTRAALDWDAEHTVHSLWIAIYDYESGDIKELRWTENGTSYASTTGRIIEPEQALNDHIVADDPVNLQTLSGRSRIVAVANIDNYAVSSHDGLKTLGVRRLRELLTQCDTYEKYCSVAALAAAPAADDGGLNTPNISLTDANMPMAGVYYHTLVHDSDKGDDVNWTSDGVNYVDLPAKIAALPGTIHLRRMHAYVDFHIIPDAGITFEPISWQVHNVPYASWCQERATDNEHTNAGDGALLGTGYEENYAPSRLSRIFVRDSKLGPNQNETGLQFSYYQFENKHEGLAKSAGTDYTGVAVYKDREREWKNGNTNTGVYKSLTASATGDANNMATYVEIEAKVTYYVDTNGNVTTDGDVGANPRMGFATYVVHLGYCEGAGEQAKSRDFNCRRNTRYTYTIRIRGLNDIVVEAKQEGETPGVEGEVTDYEGNNVIELDAHYGVFNIRMSNEDRTNLYWRIKAPYGGGYRVLSFADYAGGISSEDRTDPFYNWIRFKPTSGENVLAIYREKDIGDTAADAALWTLEDMRDVAGHKHTNGTTSATDRTQLWYTVFVDEHAYLLDANGDKADDWQQSDWTKYVNQDDRIAWLIVDKEGYKVSTDGESIYSGVKYLITQHSIQTYYSTEHTNDSHTALGVEHFNESYGKNLTWTWNAGTGYTLGVNENTDKAFSNLLSHDNGRWNCWQYLMQSTYGNYTGWSLGTPRALSTIVTSNQKDEHYPVPALVSTNNGGSRNSYYDPAPYSGEYYEIMAACMSRNRDLNGNGQIDPDELRWYLPAEGKYERIMLGRNAVTSWLFDPTRAPWYTIGDDPYAQNALTNQTPINLPSTGDDWTNGRPNWVHYASSDHRKFYTDEGGSWHYCVNVWWSTWNTEYGLWPWNIRCVRNLGTTMKYVTEDPKQDPVSRAYTYTPNGNGGGIFDATSYDDNCLRAPIQTYLPVHTIRDLDRNLIARKFEVANEDQTGEVNNTNQIESRFNRNYPCSEYAQDGDGGAVWRIPNQREMMMILTEDIITTGIYPSCTKEGYGSESRYAGINNGVMAMLDLGKIGTNFRVRCVRDIE